MKLFQLYPKALAHFACKSPRALLYLMDLLNLLSAAGCVFAEAPHTKP